MMVSTVTSIVTTSALNLGAVTAGKALLQTHEMEQNYLWNLNLVKPGGLVCSCKITFPRVDTDIAIVVDVASGFSERKNKTDILSSLSPYSR